MGLWFVLEEGLGGICLCCSILALVFWFWVGGKEGREIGVGGLFM